MFILSGFFYFTIILLLNEHVECRVFSKIGNRLMNKKYGNMVFKNHDRPSILTDTSKERFFLELRSLKEEKNSVVQKKDSEDVSVQHRAEKYEGLPMKNNNLGLGRDPTVPPDIMWPTGQIPFLVDKNSYDALLEYRLRAVMTSLESISCITFKRLKSTPKAHTYWLNVTNPEKKRECAHEIGQQLNGEIRLILGLDCLRSVEILHTLMHGIGFHDEVSHPGRDRYVRILWENIKPEYRNLFYTNNFTSSSSLEFDPLSVMSFHDRAFSKNGLPTIVPIEPNVVVAPSLSLSEKDRKKIQIKFGVECKKRKITQISDTCAAFENVQINETQIKNVSQTPIELSTKNYIEMSDCDTDYDSRNCFGRYY